eukprot:6174000-Pleurochrysis_carterae.AAC.1
MALSLAEFPDAASVSSTGMRCSTCSYRFRLIASSLPWMSLVFTCSSAVHAPVASASLLNVTNDNHQQYRSGANSDASIFATSLVAVTQVGFQSSSPFFLERGKSAPPRGKSGSSSGKAPEPETNDSLVRPTEETRNSAPAAAEAPPAATAPAAAEAPATLSDGCSGNCSGALGPSRSEAGKLSPRRSSSGLVRASPFKAADIDQVLDAAFPVMSVEHTQRMVSRPPLLKVGTWGASRSATSKDPLDTRLIGPAIAQPGGAGTDTDQLEAILAGHL